MDVKAFGFYISRHNEDAPPYTKVNEDGGLLVVADGMGGLGSYKHRLKDEDYNENLAERLRKVILPEYYSDGNQFKSRAFGEWLEEIIKPMADSETDTSALWGSRVAIPRFSYYMETHPDVDLSDASAREDIVRFIYKGITDTAEEFGLETPPEKRDLATLPTTLVGIRYKLRKDGVFVEIVYAGDSRAYALVGGKGLKQLTEDNEINELVTNYFAILYNGKTFDTQLFYRSYLLPFNSAVFACSDGFFDPYGTALSNFGVEKDMLGCLAKADSYEQFEKNWFEHYVPLTADDRSVAFAAFTPLNVLVGSLKDRIEKLPVLYDNYFKYKKVIKIIEGNEPDPAVYIRQRAKQRKREIVRIIAASLIAGEDLDDVAVKFALPLIEDRYAEIERLSGLRKQAVCERIAEDFKNNCTLAAGAFAPDQTAKGYDQTAAKLIKALLRCVDAVTDAYRYREDLFFELDTVDYDMLKSEKEKTVLFDKISKARANAKREKSLYDNICEDLKSALAFEEQFGAGKKNVSDIMRMIGFLSPRIAEYEAIDKLFAKLKDSLRKSEHVNTYDAETKNCRYMPYRQLLIETNEFIDKCNGLKHRIDKANADYKTACDIYKKASEDYTWVLKEFKSYALPLIVEAPFAYLTKDFAEKYGLPVSVEGIGITEDAVSEYFADDVIYDEMIEAFINSLQPSVIDKMFTSVYLISNRESNRKCVHKSPEKPVKSHKNIFATLT